MPRCALEVTLEVTLNAPPGPLRVVNVHLTYCSFAQRLAQVGGLRVPRRDAVLHAPPGAAAPSAFDFAFVTPTWRRARAACASAKPGRGRTTRRCCWNWREPSARARVRLE